MLIVEIIGGISVILVFTAYMLITRNKVHRSSLRYQEINLIGADCSSISARVNTAYPSAAVNILWAIIAALGLLKKILVFSLFSQKLPL